MAIPGLRVELGAVTMRSLSVSTMDNNCYLLTARTGEQVLIDAADEAEALLDLIAQHSPAGARARLDAVVTTHGHWDHVRALEAVIAATGARAYAGAPDLPAIAVRGVEPLSDGTLLGAGPINLEVIALRGHTPGSVALAAREDREGPHPGRVHLFTGDSLFPGGVGDTGRDPARFAALLGDVTARLFDRFGDDTVVYPGHGAPTTLGAQRPHLNEWRQRGW